MNKVYFISNGVGSIKIGFSADVPTRLKVLQAASGLPLTLIATIDGNHLHERAVHASLRKFRKSGEWFDDCAQVRAAIGQYCISGIEPSPKRTPRFCSEKPPERQRRKYRRVGEMDHFSVDGPLMEIDNYRLPVLDGKLMAARAARQAMEMILAETRLRKARGKDVSTLIQRADDICALVDSTSRTQASAAEVERVDGAEQG